MTSEIGEAKKMRASNGETLASVFRSERVALHMTQEQLAEAAGVSLRTVQRVERGLLCSQNTVQVLASAMGLDEQGQVAIWSAWETDRKSMSPSANLAGIWSLLPCLPGLVFVVLNLGFYEIGLSFLGPLLHSAVWGAMISHPLAYVLLLGGPLLSLVLSVPKVLQLRSRSVPGAAILEGLVIKSHATSWLTMILAIVVLAILSLYLVVENIGHLLGNQ